MKQIWSFLLCVLPVQLGSVTAMELDIRTVHGQNESSEYLAEDFPFSLLAR